MAYKQKALLHIARKVEVSYLCSKATNT